MHQTIIPQKPYIGNVNQTNMCFFIKPDPCKNIGWGGSIMRKNILYRCFAYAAQYQRASTSFILFILLKITGFYWFVGK